MCKFFLENIDFIAQKSYNIITERERKIPKTRKVIIMKKSTELKNALTEMYNNKVWNKHVEIEGENYIYISATNEFRRVIKQPSGQIAMLVGCMVQGNFMWCC